MRTIALLLMWTAVHGFACSCASAPSTKEAWRSASIVVLGTVVSVRPGVADPRGLAEQTVEVRVEEAFKGARKSQVLTLTHVVNGCSGFFKAGTRRLLYLYPEAPKGALDIRGCDRGGSDGPSEDLLFLRGLPDSARGNRISGEVEFYEDSLTEGFHRIGGAPGVRVTAVPTGGPPETAVTDGDGIYVMRFLRPGEYTVKIDTPKGWRVRFPMVSGPRLRETANEARVRLDAESDANAGFVLAANTQMRGRVLDPDGKPLKNVCVNLEALSTNSGNGRISSCTGADGAYLLEMIPPGPYRVAANGGNRRSAAAPFGAVYYPGVADRNDAQIVTVSEGGMVDGVDIRIPSMAPVVRLSGRVLFQDGVPAPGADVEFVAGSRDYRESAATGPDGKFSMQVLADQRGEIHAKIMVWKDEVAECPQFGTTIHPNGWAGTLESAPALAASKADQSGIVLTLAAPSCTAWPKRRE